jgi:3-oxoacyl-[acyl-carrier protein] reductase
VGLDGRVALVTGGGTGIGRATSLALAEAGCDVAINYSRSEREANETAEAARGLGRRACVVQADVSDEAAVRRMVETVADGLGGLDVLVNNAGTTRYAPLTDLDAITDEHWESIFAVNLRGPFYCARAALPHLRRSGRGKIVNTVSNSAFRPTGSSIPYMSSKAALVMLTRSLARALAPQVQVNAIAPGWLTETRWAERHLPPEAAAAVYAQAGSGATAALEDIAQTVVFLASTDSITGEVVIIDRGQNL